MLLGNVGIVTSLSSLMLTFIEFGQGASTWLKLGVLALGIGLLWLAASSRFIDKWLSRLISKALNRYTDIKARDYTSLLRLTGDYTITEMQVSEEDWMADTKVRELNLTEEGILILGVTRPEGNYIGAPQADTGLKSGDNLLLYGRSEALKNLDKRRKGAGGDVEHDMAVEKQKKVVEKEQRQEGKREEVEGEGHE
jgi:K+/H+ antiporter YhaU regulatory subunit KhtT